MTNVQGLRQRGPMGFCSCSCLALADKILLAARGPLLQRPPLLSTVNSRNLIDLMEEGLCCGIEPVLPAERVGGVGDDGVAGARPQVLQVEGGHGARHVVGEQAAEAATILLLVDLKVEAGRVPAVEPRLALKEELL